MEDDGIMVKNEKNLVIKKSGEDERFFEENRTNLKYKKGNRAYTIHGGHYKRKSDPKNHIDPTFDASPRSGDARLVMILILFLILPP